MQHKVLFELKTPNKNTGCTSFFGLVSHGFRVPAIIAFLTHCTILFSLFFDSTEKIYRFPVDFFYRKSVEKNTSEKSPKTGYCWLQMMIFLVFKSVMVAQREIFRILRTQTDFLHFQRVWKRFFSEGLRI